MTTTVQVYDPTAPEPRQAQLPRHTLESLEGAVVGFVDNSKPNFEHLADDLGDLLMSRYGVRSVVKHRKHMASIPAPEAVMKDLESRCDFVIVGAGD